MLDFHAPVLYYAETGFLGTSGGLIVLDPELGPYYLNIAALKCFIDYFRNLVARPKDVDDIYFLFDL